MSSGQNVGNVFLTLKATGMSAFQKQVKNEGNKAAGVMTKTFSSAFSKIGAITAAALSTRAIKSFVKESIDIASDLAEVQNVVDVTFGNSAKIINDFAESAPKAYGLSTLAAKQYSGTIGAMLKSMRIAKKDVLGMSTSIASLAGDMASFYNLDTDTAFEKIRSGISGETEPLKQLGINLSVANLEQYRMNKGITTAYNKMSQANQAILRYNYLLETTADAQGDFARTSNSWANQTRILALNIDTLKASVGNLAIQALTPLIIKLNQIIEYAIAAAQALTQLFGGKVDTSPAGAGMSAVSASAVQAAGDMTDTAKTAKKTAKAIKASFADFDEIHLLGSPKDDSSAGADAAGAAGGQSLSPVTLAGNDIKNSKVIADADTLLKKMKDTAWYAGAVGAAIGAWKITNAISGLDVLNGKLSKIQRFKLAAGIALIAAGATLEIKGAISIIKTGKITPQNFVELVGGAGMITAGGALVGSVFGSAALGAAGGAIVGGVGMAFVGIWNAISNGLNWLNGLLIPAGTALAGAGIGAMIGAVGGPLGAAIGAGVGLVIDGIIAIVQHWDTISAWFEESFSKLGEFFSGVWNSISGAASKCWNAIVGFFSPAINWFKNLFGEIKQTASDIFYNIGVIVKGCWQIVMKILEPVTNWINEKIIQPVTSFFTTLWRGFTDKAKVAWEGVKIVFSSVASFFKSTFQTAWQGIIKVFSAAGQIFTKIKDGIVSAFKKVVNGLITGLNKVVAVPFNGINSALDRIRNVNIMGISPFSGLRSIHVPQVPYLEQGGYLTKNNPTLAVVGDNKREGEIVSPESKIREQVELALSKVRGNTESVDLAGIIKQAIREALYELQFIFGGDWHIVIVDERGTVKAEHIISAAERKNRRDGKNRYSIGVIKWQN